jgi:hypothetical protein
MHFTNSSQLRIWSGKRISNFFTLGHVMENGKFIAMIYVLGMVTALISTVEAADFNASAVKQSALTRNDHEALAKSYENAANEMQAKVDEKKQLLGQYKEKSYIYGRKAQDLQAHTHALIRKYDKAAKLKMQKAALHWQIAGQLEEDSFCVPPTPVERC